MSPYWPQVGLINVRDRAFQRSQARRSELRREGDSSPRASASPPLRRYAMHGSSTRIFNLTDIPAPSFSTRRGGCRTAALRR